MAALCLAVGTVEAPAQGVFGKLKKQGLSILKDAAKDAAPKPVKKVMNKVEETENKARRATQAPARQRRQTERRRQESFEPGKQTLTVKFCEGVGRKEWYGRVGGVTPQPPASCPKQPAWSEALPLTWHLDNARLVAEHNMLEKWLKDGKPSCEPVLVRREAIIDEVNGRAKALDKVAEQVENTEPDEAYLLAEALEEGMFKHAAASDLTPLYPYLDDRTVAFLKGIDRKTKTLSVQVYKGNSADGRRVQTGEMWFLVNPSKQTATLEYLDMDQSAGKDYTVPATISYCGRTFKVTAIGATAFTDLKIRSVTLSEGLKTIGTQAFSRTALTSLDIPSTVTKLEPRALAEMPQLKSIVIPDAVKHIGHSMFSMDKALTSATLPASVDELGNSAFLGCTALTKVTLPRNITKLPQSTFEDCKSLTQVDVPDGVTLIDQNAFKNTAITAVPVPASLTLIESNAFKGCSRLTSVSLPARVNLEFNAFADCKGLKKVAVGKQYKDDPSTLYDFFMGCPFVSPQMTKAPACVSFTE